MTTGEKLASRFVKEHRYMLWLFGINRNERVIAGVRLWHGVADWFPRKGERVVYGPHNKAVVVRRKTWRERLPWRR